jgi:hypothetical protein
MTLSMSRVALVIPAMLALSGCIAAVPLVTGTALSGGMTALTKTATSGQLDQSYFQNFGPEMAEGLKIGKKRHPDVYGSLSVEDDEYLCLFKSEVNTYIGWMDAIGPDAAAMKAVDNAAERSRRGECGDLDRTLKLFNPFDFS